MASIEVSESLMAELKSLAEPFVDTPETVIRRLLSSYKQHATKAPKTSPVIVRPSKRAPRSAVTSRRKMQAVLALMLAWSKEGLTRQEAMDAVEAHLGDRLTQADRGKSATGTIRWQANVGFSRKDLIERGVIDGDAPRGLWRLTKQWEKKVGDIPPVLIHPAPDAPVYFLDLHREDEVDALLYPPHPEEDE